jgi:hypothetical protein
MEKKPSRELQRVIGELKTLPDWKRREKALVDLPKEKRLKVICSPLLKHAFPTSGSIQGVQGSALLPEGGSFIISPGYQILRRGLRYIR